MKNRRLLGRFWPRLMGQALVVSVLNGLVLSALSLLALSTLFHILIQTPQGALLVYTGVAGFTLGFLAGMCKSYPTRRRIAKRLDQTGLQERSGTMLEFAGEQGTLIQLQRKDARAHIQKVHPRQLKRKLPLRRLLLAAVAVILAASMLLIPYDIFAPGDGMSAEERARARQVDALIDQLRDQIDQTGLPDYMKDALNLVLTQLYADLMATDDQLEQAALVEQARVDMAQILQGGISRYALGAALQRFELTRPLGKELAGNTLGLHDVLQDLLAQLLQDPVLVTKLSNNLKVALEDSGVAPDDALYQALLNFSTNLAAFSYSLNPDYEGDPEEGGEPIVDEGVPESLEEVFENAERQITEALDGQMLLEAEYEQVDASMGQGISDLLGDLQRPGGNQAPSGPSGVMDGGSLGSGGGAGSGGQTGGMSSGPAGKPPSDMLEPVYDPISGSVIYGDVFAAYFAQYLQALEEGEFSPELLDLLDSYFTALS